MNSARKKTAPAPARPRVLAPAPAPPSKQRQTSFTPEEELKVIEQATAQLQMRGLLTLAADIAAKNFVTLNELLSPWRGFGNVTRARGELCDRLRAEPYNMSTPMIGKILVRDHTTILCAARVGARRRELSECLDQAIASLTGARKELRVT